MKQTSKILLITLFFLSCLGAFSQIASSNEFVPNPEREKMFLPYLAVRHGGLPTIEEWKKNNTVQYYKELWYYTESFYVKRNYFSEGITMDESMIDVSRFEADRKEDTEFVIALPGHRDAIVLLPANKLKHNPYR
jgi:hypothetical protein